MNIEDAPKREAISVAKCLPYTTLRPSCACCGGVKGVRAAFRRRRKENCKPRRKDHNFYRARQIMKYQYEFNHATKCCCGLKRTHWHNEPIQYAPNWYDRFIQWLGW